MRSLISIFGALITAGKAMDDTFAKVLPEQNNTIPFGKKRKRQTGKRQKSLKIRSNRRKAKRRQKHTKKGGRIGTA